MSTSRELPPLPEPDAFAKWFASLTPEQRYDFDSEGRGYKKDATHMMRLAYAAATADTARKCVEVCEAQPNGWEYEAELAADSMREDCAAAIRSAFPDEK